MGCCGKSKKTPQSNASYERYRQEILNRYKNKGKNKSGNEGK